MAEKQRGRRGDPNYTQITALVPKDIGLDFKAECTRNEISISEAIEQLIRHRGEKEGSEQLERAYAFIRAILESGSMDGIALAKLADEMGKEVNELHTLLKKNKGKVTNGH